MSFLGTRCRGEDDGPSARLAVPSLSIASNSDLATAKRSGASRRGRQATGGPGVVQMWCVVLCRTSLWVPVGFVSSGKSCRRVSGGVPPAMTLKRDG